MRIIKKSFFYALLAIAVLEIGFFIYALSLPVYRLRNGESQLTARIANSLIGTVQANFINPICPGGIFLVAWAVIFVIMKLLNSKK
jgi:23S rRNA G2445 N2-methylase RlmL